MRTQVTALFSRRLAMARAAVHLTQLELAEEVGYDQGMISHVELNKARTIPAQFHRRLEQWMQEVEADVAQPTLDQVATEKPVSNLPALPTKVESFPTHCVIWVGHTKRALDPQATFKLIQQLSEAGQRFKAEEPSLDAAIKILQGAK